MGVKIFLIWKCNNVDLFFLQYPLSSWRLSYRLHGRVGLLADWWNAPWEMLSPGLTSRERKISSFRFSKKYLIEREVLEDESLDGQDQEVFPKHKFSELQKRIWYLFEHPASSQGAKLIAMFSIFCIFVSTLLLTLDTLPFFQVMVTNKSHIFHKLHNV